MNKLMSVAEVAEFINITEARVKRLARESLLSEKDKDDKGEPLFDAEDVKRYKQLAERIGGI